MSFFSGLQRRSVLRVGMAYAAVAWLLLKEVLERDSRYVPAWNL